MIIFRLASLNSGLRSLMMRSAPLAALVVAASIAPVATAQHPNIVFIVSDDQSWRGTSVQMDPHGVGAASASDFYETPNLEMLAQNGMRFSQAYAPAPICSPSRAAMFTGMSPAQAQFTTVREDIPYPSPTRRFLEMNNDLPLTTPIPNNIAPLATLPLGSLIKSATGDGGQSLYATGHFGKWHLPRTGFGNDTQTLAAYGYDVHRGSKDPGGGVAEDPKRVFWQTDRTLEFVEENKDRPFFVHLDHFAVHLPQQYQSDTVQYFQDKYDALSPAEQQSLAHYDVQHAAMTKELDTAVGDLMTYLNQTDDPRNPGHKLVDNTYIFFYSDNGGFHDPRPNMDLHDQNVPLLEGKTTLWEGGIRVPLIVQGPGVAANSVSDVPVVGMDLVSTFASLAGAGEHVPDYVEGADLSGLLTNEGQLPDGESALFRPHHGDDGELFFHFPHWDLWKRTRPVSAVVDGDLKLIKQYGWGDDPDEIFLFDLGANITESDDVNSPLNLAGAMPDVANQLHAKLKDWLERVDAPMAYDVRTPVDLQWSGDENSRARQQGSWRSVTDVDYRMREQWLENDQGADQPQVQSTPNLVQPGLSQQAYQLAKNGGFTRKYFHVSDAHLLDNDREGHVQHADLLPVEDHDLDHSASIEMWVRFDQLDREQMLFETGDANQGLSITVGDGDDDGRFNQVRLRGANDEDDAAFVLTAQLDAFADPSSDFVQLTAVLRDDAPSGQQVAELYVNGYLAAESGPMTLVDWDGFGQAGLGRVAGDLGGVNGPGAAPFAATETPGPTGAGGFAGQIAAFRFANFALESSDVADAYNARLSNVGFGVLGVSGNASVAGQRPTDVSRHANETAGLQIVQERNDVLEAELMVDALIDGEATLDANSPGLPGDLTVGTRLTSYLLRFDPEGELDQTPVGVAGSVTFAGEILGIILEGSRLVESDAFLSTIGNYGQEEDRGLVLQGEDFLTVGADERTLDFSLTAAGDESLQFRVLAALPDADFNDDGAVDQLDLTAWENSFGLDGLADATADGVSDGADLLQWQRQFGAAPAGFAQQVATPEPTTWILCLIGVIALWASRRADSRRRPKFRAASSSG